ncbi:MAG: cobalt transporter CbiM [Acidobacteria bacterium]|nr:MAG: cobalt transporter CbiM [Acidobacteriota bacterium]
MHIPDGYLSPTTCAALYAGAAPFWYVALRKTRKLLLTRLVPMVSVFAAFSFVIMMFNIPIPGGTTAHPLGVAIASIVLGPWASILGISTALFIQAFFFGDGGVTALGANCFNMAIVGSLVAWLVYRAGAGRSPITSSRRVVAAALGGYLAINGAALCAALELGLQPYFFKSATGAPLYAPYPLGIAIPAIMIGHLTFAGLAELVVTGGVVAYLQRANPELLRFTAPGLPLPPGGARLTAPISGWRAARPLWTAVGLLMVLTPLGLLAAGKAWGEWSVRDFVDPAARQQMAAASKNVVPPAAAPSGLERLSSLWTAPFPDYSPPFVRSAAFGYILSAIFGIGAIILLIILAGWIAQKARPGPARAPAHTEET